MINPISDPLTKEILFAFQIERDKPIVIDNEKFFGFSTREELYFNSFTKLFLSKINEIERKREITELHKKQLAFQNVLSKIMYERTIDGFNHSLCNYIRKYARFEHASILLYDKAGND